MPSCARKDSHLRERQLWQEPATGTIIVASIAMRGLLTGELVGATHCPSSVPGRLSPSTHHFAAGALPRHGRCHGLLDPLGDHRLACAISSVLATRALPFEHAVTRVCRKAGAQVAEHVFRRHAKPRFTAAKRCIEVVAMACGTSSSSRSMPRIRTAALQDST